MKTIKINLVLVTLLTVILCASCKDYFDLNENPNLVQDPPINSMLTTATQKAALNMQQFGSITSYYAQYLANPSASGAADTYQITDDSEEWNDVYYAMADLYDMIQKAESTSAYLHAGVAKIMMAYQLGLVADIWGQAPYTDAFYGTNTLTPKYDDEESLYNESLRLIEEGLSDLGRTDYSTELDGESDLMHQGNVASWIKTGFGLKARFLNKISKKTSYDPNAVLAALDQSYASNEDESSMNVFLGVNPWAQIAISNANNLLGGWLSDNFINHLNGNTYGFEDPRIAKITDKTINNNYVGTRNGQGNVGGANTVHDECYISINSPFTAETAPLVIMTYAELKFVEAEAALRAGDNNRAYAAYLAGIQANMDKLGVAPVDRNAYLQNGAVAVGATNLNLALIFKEKYVATYLNPEAWNDMRRNDYQYKDFRLPLNAYLSNFIRRVAYPADERGRNSSNVPADEPLDTPLWWDRP
ncbi:SusD/RagB family nutrient-binding outer membrane lipoprotein [Olivibacter sp. CPCC 100613]|uniref:SusD/RagB family nutrient-binding outer membrane lipoprotein n=1 Tax=Olivibacter sp. CPCC 100613 TaxID=3079931 RepID=UPI002FFC6104